MALNIKDPEADRLARELAKLTGESLTEAVVTSLRERLDAESRRRGRTRRLAEIRRIQERVARLPVLDTRTADEILGYGDDGLPK